MVASFVIDSLAYLIFFWSHCVYANKNLLEVRTTKEQAN